MEFLKAGLVQNVTSDCRSVGRGQLGLTESTLLGYKISLFQKTQESFGCFFCAFFFFLIKKD